MQCALERVTKPKPFQIPGQKKKKRRRGRGRGEGRELESYDELESNVCSNLNITCQAVKCHKFSLCPDALFFAKSKKVHLGKIQVEAQIVEV